jgi:predicted DNA-binding transcriptional regulator AlpA
VRPERISNMPNWPARMDAPMAAAYLGIGTTRFDEGVKAKRYPAPVQEGRRKLWAKAQLDRFVESQFGIATASGEVDDTWHGFN